MNNHNDRIKKHIKTAIDRFKAKSIDFRGLNSSVIGNISALDNLSKDIENAAINLCGELEIIHFTIGSDKEHEAMLVEIEKFEPYLDKI